MSRVVVVFCDQTPERAMRNGPELERVGRYLDGVAKLIEARDPDKVIFCGGPTPRRERLANHTPAAGTALAVFQRLPEDPDAPARIVDGPKQRSGQFNELVKHLRHFGRSDEVILVCERRLRVVPFIYLGRFSIDAKVEIVPIGNFRTGVTNFAKGSVLTLTGN